MDWNAKWIRPSEEIGHFCPIFKKEIILRKHLKSATLRITVTGVYVAYIGDQRIGDFILAPGWTSYKKRHQYQTYDITDLLTDDNTLYVLVGHGWYRGRPAAVWGRNPELYREPAGLIAELALGYSDGSSELYRTDESWQWSISQVISSDIYDGECYDGSFVDFKFMPVIEYAGISITQLIEQQGEKVIENEKIKPRAFFTTPAGEHVLDFGQNMTGYVQFTVDARKGDGVSLSCAETLDRDGNFYTVNYRSAKSKIDYICRDGIQTYKPLLTFFGFRYIRIDAYPGEIHPDDFTAIVVHSEMKRTGYLISSNDTLNRLFSNIIWGQKGNFLDVPTDCPQRDERMGWSGDAHVFIKTASYQFDVERFFRKWLADLAIDQTEDGRVPNVIPDIIGEGGSPAWGDTACICPWQLYLTYGNPAVLHDQFHSMKKWVDYITGTTTEAYLWTGRVQYGDWLALDCPKGSLKGLTRDEFIASAFYAYSVSLVIKAGKAISKDVTEYETLYRKIADAFKKRFYDFRTQTEYVLAIHFNLADDKPKAGDELAELIEKGGGGLTTGFVGTPYLLYALSETGHIDLAYSLLLREEYPSWLFSVKHGATTVWEHWDGIREDGSFWGTEMNSRMNSFNHYAYGAVADWVYTVAAGIQTVEEHPGFEQIMFCPKPDKRLSHLCAEIETRHGKVRSAWQYVGEDIRYEITTPSPATIVIRDKIYFVPKGCYIF